MGLAVNLLSNLPESIGPAHDVAKVEPQGIPAQQPAGEYGSAHGVDTAWPVTAAARRRSKVVCTYGHELSVPDTRSGQAPSLTRGDGYNPCRAEPAEAGQDELSRVEPGRASEPAVPSRAKFKELWAAESSKSERCG